MHGNTLAMPLLLVSTPTVGVLRVWDNYNQSVSKPCGTPIDCRCLICSGIAENEELAAVEDFIDVGNIQGKSWVCLWDLQLPDHQSTCTHDAESAWSETCTCTLQVLLNLMISFEFCLCCSAKLRGGTKESWSSWPLNIIQNHFNGLTAKHWCKQTIANFHKRYQCDSIKLGINNWPFHRGARNLWLFRVSWCWNFNNNHMSTPFLQLLLKYQKEYYI